MNGERIGSVWTAWMAALAVLAASAAASVSCQIGPDEGGGASAFGSLERATGPGCVRYVYADAPAQGDGLSWATAFRRVQAGIQAAKAAAHGATCEVWVAEGTYYVYRHNAHDTVRLRRRVDVYGGFAGGETDRRSRSPAVHETVLDGHKHAGSAEQV